ncbi:MAG: C25 family cysteine peptidase [Fidelibacterota bacterium]
MKRLLTISSVLIFGVTTLFAKEWEVASSSGVEQLTIDLLGSTINHSELSFRLDGFYTDFIDIDGQNYVVVTHPDAPGFLLEGFPGLPRVNRSLIIPDIGAIEVTVTSIVYKEYKLGPVAPSKGNLLRTQNPEDIPYVFNEYYQTDNWFPAENVTLSEPFIFRGVRGVNVQFQPFQYNPSSQTLRVAMEMTISLDAIPGEAPNSIHRQNRIPSNRDFVRIQKDFFANFEETQDIYYEGIEEPGYLVIITFDDFIDAIQPLAEWKLQKGIPTEVVPLSSIGSTTSDILSFLQTRYDTGELTYVILVGDDAQIPTLYGSTGAGSDPSYVMLDGSDYYPDAFISRISATTESEVADQVAKFLAYEIDPPGSVWFSRGLGVASAEGSSIPPDYLADWERAELLRDMLMNYTYSDVDQIYDPGASLSELVSALNEGRSIFNYIGHGAGTYWGTTGFSNSHASSLNNGFMMPFVIDVSCLNGQWHGTTCLAEAFMRNPEGGAVGMFSSSVSCSWVPPTVMQYHIVELLTTEQRNTMGGLSMHGSIHTLESYNGGSEGIAIVEEYILFGDCTLPMRTVSPITVTASHDPIIPLGSTSFSVLTIPGAMVGLTMDGILYGTAIAGADGIANVEFEEALSVPGAITVTVTAYNFLPYITEVNVIQPEGPYVAFDSYTIYDINGNFDGTVDFGETVDMFLSVTNVGVEEAFNVTGIITSEDPLVTMIDGDVTFGNIASDETVTSQDELIIIVSEETEDGHIIPFSIVINGTDSNGSELQWESNFSVTVEAPVLGFVSYSLEGTGENGVFDPGETVQLVVTLSNEGAEDATSVMAEIAESSSYITVDDNQTYFATVTAGGSVSNSSNPFTVTASTNTPLGTEIEFTLTVTAQNNYTIVETFSLIVGQNQFFSEDVPLDFGPNNIESILNIPVSFLISDINVMVDITHPWVGDIQLRLRSPAGTEVALVTNQGGSGDNFTETVFDDDAETPIDSGTPPYNGSFQPEEPLANFNSEESLGSWTLIVIDTYPSLDDGTLNAWSLTISGESSSPCEKGDVNSDGFIDVFDVIKTVNIILGIDTEPTEDEICAADYDDDGSVDVFDVVKMVNYILGIGQTKMTAPATSAVLIQSGETISLSANGPVAALQFSIETESEIIPLTIEGLEILYNRISETTVEVLIFSMDGTTLEKDKLLTVKGNYSLRDIQVSNLKGEKVAAEIRIVPEEFVLFQNYPNPFNPITTISYDLPEEGYVRLVIYDILGQEIVNLVDEEQSAGSYQVRWEPDNIASGIYIYRLIAAGTSRTARMILLK